MLLALSLHKPSTHSRDITNVYTKFATSLERDIYIRAPIEIGNPFGKAVKVVEPLYSNPESEISWYLIHTEHHTGKTELSQSRADTSLLYELGKWYWMEWSVSSQWQLHCWYNTILKQRGLWVENIFIRTEAAREQ